ncbi:MAG: hypothetical protein ACI85K_003039 [Hyphomicrobiaceae bacterium]|jgi:hypothetical protein
MRVFATICAMSLSLPVVHAQVHASIRALTPLTVQVSDSLSSASATTPAGLLSTFGESIASLPSPSLPASGAVRWRVRDTFVSLEHSLGNPSAIPSFSGVLGPHEFLIEFQAQTPRAAIFRASRLSALSGGAPAATIAIDVDNDGTIEIANLSTLTPATFAVIVGPQPLQVRVIVNATLGAAAYVYEESFFAIIPDNNLQITQVVSSCAPFVPPPPAVVLPSFLHTGIDLVQPFSLGVIVLGLAPQPNLLSVFSQSGLPCVLMPRADVTLYVSTMDLPIPLAVRPITVYAQAVGLVAGELVASDAYSVMAH